MYFKYLLFLTSFALCSISAQTPFKSLNYLYSIAGTHIVSGQHNDQKPYNGNATGADFWTNEVYAITGKYPALYGCDLLFHGSDAKRWEVTYEAEHQWEEGAIVNMMWHACPPTQSEPCGWDGGVKSSLSTAQWLDLLTEGGALNAAWKSQIDNIAAPYLQYLEDKGVEVFWRPFHEQNQPIFWWNSGTPENTIALWQLTHDYMTNILGLSNLIWSWDVQDIQSTFSSYNPGGNYFDLAALDVYSSGFYDLQFYNDLLTEANSKPVAFGESFNMPSASVIASQPQMSFFMIWAYGLYVYENGQPSNSTQDVLDTYSNPRVITRDEMPGWNVATASKPRCIVDFEVIPYQQGAWNGSAAVVANPLVTANNASANVCRYTVPSNKAWSNCAWVSFDEVISYGTLDSLQIMIKAPSATQMHVKLENSGDGGVSPIVANSIPVASSEWQCVTLHFPAPSGTASLSYAFDKLAIFFNVNDATGGEVWYYDSVLVYEQVENAIPIANAGDDQEVAVGDVVVLDASASSDADGDALSFSWVSPQGFAVNGVGAERPSFTVSSLAEGRDLAFSLVVNDGSVDSYADTVLVAVESLPTHNDEHAAALSVYPNPVYDYLTISSIPNLRTVEIYNMSGALVANESVCSSAQQMYVGHCLSGFYLLKVIDENDNVEIVKFNKL